MKRIRGGSGFGDALYLRAALEHLIKLRPTKYVVCTDYPTLFTDLPVNLEPFGKKDIHVLAHYTRGKSNPKTTQWQDVCESAFCQPTELPFTSSWKVKNHKLVDDLVRRANGRPIILVHGGRVPMGRTDGFGIELLPSRAAFESVLSEFSDCFKVRFGKSKCNVYGLSVDYDLGDQTSVSDIMDLGSSCDGVVCQCSLAVPLGEIFDKPVMAVWSQKGLTAKHAYIRQITPHKILSKPSSLFVIDSWTHNMIKEEVRGLRLVCG